MEPLPTSLLDPEHDGDDGLLDVPGRLKGLIVKERHEESKGVFPRLSRSASAPKKATSTDYGSWYNRPSRHRIATARSAMGSRDFEYSKWRVPSQFCDHQPAQTVQTTDHSRISSQHLAIRPQNRTLFKAVQIPAARSGGISALLQWLQTASSQDQDAALRILQVLANLDQPPSRALSAPGIRTKQDKLPSILAPKGVERNLQAQRQQEMKQLQQDYTTGWHQVQLQAGQHPKPLPVVHNPHGSLLTCLRGKSIRQSPQRGVNGLWQHMHRNPQPYPPSNPENSSAMFTKLGCLDHDFSIHPDWGLEVSALQ